MDYRSLLDIAYIDHHGINQFKDDFISSLGGQFDTIAGDGIDIDIRPGRLSCISKSTKKYVVLADADDLLIPETFCDMVEFLETNGEYDSCCGIDYAFRNNQVPEINRKSKFHKPMELTYDHVIKGPLVMHNCVVWRTEILRAFLADNQSNESIRKDTYDFDLRREFIKSGHRVMKLPLIGTLWRIRTDGGNHRALIAKPK